MRLDISVIPTALGRARAVVAPVIAILLVSSCGSSRPGLAGWSSEAQPAIVEIIQLSGDFTPILDRVPGDYVPIRMLNSCDEFEPRVPGWKDALQPTPSSDIDAIVDRLVGALETVCVALREADMVTAQAAVAGIRRDANRLLSLEQTGG